MQDLKQAKKQILEVYEQDQFALAFVLTKKARQRFEPDVRLEFLHAECMRQMGMKGAYEILSALTPPNAQAEFQIQVALGMNCVNECQPAKACNHFERAIKLNRAVTFPFVFLASALMTLKEYVRAIEVLKEGLTAEGDIDEIHFNLGSCYRALGDFGTARQEYLKTLALDPAYPEVREAVEDLEAALKESPSAEEES